MGGGRHGWAGALYHPRAYKHRFCESYSGTNNGTNTVCQRGATCAFAHSREEIRTPLLAEEEQNQEPHAMTDDFVMFKFKTLWCPVGRPHDWHTCVYAHTYQDARRHPNIGYGSRPCPHWNREETTLEYSQRCPMGLLCPYSHGAKEQLYHPAYFKTKTCYDCTRCSRSVFCAFWHDKWEQRKPLSTEDEFNYQLALPEIRLREALQPDFLSPLTFQQDAGKHKKQQLQNHPVAMVKAPPQLPIFSGAVLSPATGGIMVSGSPDRKALEEPTTPRTFFSPAGSDEAPHFFFTGKQRTPNRKPQGHHRGHGNRAGALAAVRFPAEALAAAAAEAVAQSPTATGPAMVRVQQPRDLPCEPRGRGASSQPWPTSGSWPWTEGMAVPGIGPPPPPSPGSSPGGHMMYVLLPTAQLPTAEGVVVPNSHATTVARWDNQVQALGAPSLERGQNAISFHHPPAALAPPATVPSFSLDQDDEAIPTYDCVVQLRKPEDFGNGSWLKPEVLESELDLQAADWSRTPSSWGD